MAKFCPKCGTEMEDNASFCSNCGNKENASVNSSTSNKDWLTTLLLCIFLGGLGAHRFYVNKIGSGVAQLLTAGGCGIWTLVDLIMIITGKFEDAEGNVIASK